MQKELTAKRLREVLHYAPETGVFTRMYSGSRKDSVGKPAGTRTQAGYLVVCVDSRTYFAHRLAYLYMTGGWPEDQIDHIDGVKEDNRWANLRGCTAAENQQNRARRKDANNPYRGVYWHSRDRRWVAAVSVRGRKVNLGSFPSAEEARDAAVEARARHYEFQPTARD